MCTRMMRFGGPGELITTRVHNIRTSAIDSMRYPAHRQHLLHVTPCTYTAALLRMHPAFLRVDFMMRGGCSGGGSEASGGRGDLHARRTHDGGGAFISVGIDHHR